MAAMTWLAAVALAAGGSERQHQSALIGVCSGSVSGIGVMAGAGAASLMAAAGGKA